MFHRTWLCILVLTGLAAADTVDLKTAVARVRALEKERIAIANKLAKSVCAVFRGGGGGSGVVITKDGLVLSNFHVTELTAEMRIGMNDQRIHPSVLIGTDPSGDLSLLRLTEPKEWNFTKLGDSDALKQGDWVYAMGNPFLLATDFTPTVTLGVVSGINRYQPGSIRGQLLYPDCIQTDAAINPGNSGGPLFSLDGEVVGINGRGSFRFHERGKVAVGVGYAISANQIKHCLPEMRAGMVVQHGTLNALVRDDIDPKWRGGIRVTFHQMLSPSCAEDAGIKVGDALMSFQGEPVTETNDFLRRIAVLPKGRRVSLRVSQYKDGTWTEKDLRIKLDGVEIVKKSAVRGRKVPEVYLRHEVDRTLAAARGTLQPIEDETASGTLTVRGREPKPLRISHTAGSISRKYGDSLRTATEEGGTDGEKPLDPDKRADMFERRNYWNDLLSPDGTKHFESITLTGGALVNGKTVDRLEATAKDGSERVYFIDLDSGRLVRADIKSRQWVRWISLFLTDWRKAGGRMRPYRIEIWDRDKEKLLQTIEYESIIGS
ncbi:MAG: trypsin-like peptidase domain-containing protein [Planctomycetota bacterium]